MFLIVTGKDTAVGACFALVVVRVTLNKEAVVTCSVLAKEVNLSCYNMGNIICYNPSIMLGAKGNSLCAVSEIQ